MLYDQLWKCEVFLSVALFWFDVANTAAPCCILVIIFASDCLEYLSLAQVERACQFDGWCRCRLLQTRSRQCTCVSVSTCSQPSIDMTSSRKLLLKRYRYIFHSLICYSLVCTVHHLILGWTLLAHSVQRGWLISRVVSMLDSGAEGPRFPQIAAAMLSGNCLRQTVHTHCASVH